MKTHEELERDSEAFILRFLGAIYFVIIVMKLAKYGEPAAWSWFLIISPILICLMISVIYLISDPIIELLKKEKRDSNVKYRENLSFHLREIDRIIEFHENMKEQGKVDPAAADAIITRSYERKAELEELIKKEEEK